MGHYVEELFPVASAARRFQQAQIDQATRNAYQSIADACQAYSHRNNWDRRIPELFPPEIALAMYTLVENALRGNRENSFESLFAIGAPSLRVEAINDIQWACR